MPFGSGKYTYDVQEGWGQLPNGWTWGWIPAVACDSQDNVFVYSRSEHPLVIFDREGNFLDSWGEDILEDAHGIFIDAADNVWCTERNTHCVRQFDRNGQLRLTLGTPNRQADSDGEPFRLPTDLAAPRPRASSSSPTATATRASTSFRPPANCSSPGASGATGRASSSFPTACAWTNGIAFGSATAATTASRFSTRKATTSNSGRT